MLDDFIDDIVSSKALFYIQDLGEREKGHDLFLDSIFILFYCLKRYTEV